MSHKKFGPDRFSRFDVYWIQTDRHPNRQTNKQTNRRAKFINRYMPKTLELDRSVVYFQKSKNVTLPWIPLTNFAYKTGLGNPWYSKIPLTSL